MKSSLKNISKLMSLVLRHEPEYLGIELDEQGWTSVTALMEKMNEKGIVVDFDTIKEVVDSNDKKRFAFSEDMTMIRANQGHSVKVELDLPSAVAPDILYHGTALHLLEIILKDGLQKRQRHHVHLSADVTIARSVGTRHGKPVVLEVDAKAMQTAGHVFYLSQNGIWLVDHVAPVFLRQIGPV